MKLKDLTMKKNTAIKTIPYKVQRKKIGKKINRVSVNCGAISSDQINL